jgi:hypothetical protein
MWNRLDTQSLGLAALVTLGLVGSIGAIANREYRGAADHLALVAQLEAPVGVQQVVVTGNRVQQVTVVGHRRG